MKSHIGILAVAVIALVCGLAFSQNPPVQDPPAQNADKLEKDLAASRLRIEALAAEVADLKTQMAATLKYLDAQAKSATAMVAVLEESEKAGFTWGLNPDSRHILLRGWREQLATAQKDVPAEPVVVPEGAPTKPAAKAPAKMPEKSQAKSGY